MLHDVALEIAAAHPGGRRRRDRQRQDDLRQAADPVDGPDRAAGCCCRACRWTRCLRLAARPGRDGPAGRLPVRHHGRRQRALRAAGPPTPTSSRPSSSSGWPTGWPVCATASRPGWGSGASRCPPASASWSRSPGRTSPTRTCSCSTRPPARSTRRPRCGCAGARGAHPRPDDGHHRPPAGDGRGGRRGGRRRPRRIVQRGPHAELVRARRLRRPARLLDASRGESEASCHAGGWVEGGRVGQAAGRFGGRLGRLRAGLLDDVREVSPASTRRARLRARRVAVAALPTDAARRAARRPVATVRRSGWPPPALRRSGCAARAGSATGRRLLDARARRLGTWRARRRRSTPARRRARAPQGRPARRRRCLGWLQAGAVDRRSRPPAPSGRAVAGAASQASRSGDCRLRGSARAGGPAASALHLRRAAPGAPGRSSPAPGVLPRASSQRRGRPARAATGTSGSAGLDARPGRRRPRRRGPGRRRAPVHAGRAGLGPAPAGPTVLAAKTGRCSSAGRSARARPRPVRRRPPSRGRRWPARAGRRVLAPVRRYAARRRPRRRRCAAARDLGRRAAPGAGCAPGRRGAPARRSTCRAAAPLLDGVGSRWRCRRCPSSARRAPRCRPRGPTAGVEPGDTCRPTALAGPRAAPRGQPAARARLARRGSSRPQRRRRTRTQGGYARPGAGVRGARRRGGGAADGLQRRAHPEHRGRARPAGRRGCRARRQPRDHGRTAPGARAARPVVGGAPRAPRSSTTDGRRGGVSPARARGHRAPATPGGGGGAQAGRPGGSAQARPARPSRRGPPAHGAHRCPGAGAGGRRWQDGEHDLRPAPSAPPTSTPAIAARLKRERDGLVAAVAQQHDTGEVLMVGWMDDEALHRTLTTGRCTYWSRSRRSTGSRARRRAAAVGEVGRARLRRRHGAGEGRPGRQRRVPHRRPHLLRRRPAARRRRRAGVERGRRRPRGHPTPRARGRRPPCPARSSPRADAAGRRRHPPAAGRRRDPVGRLPQARRQPAGHLPARVGRAGPAVVALVLRRRALPPAC